MVKIYFFTFLPHGCIVLLYVFSVNIIFIMEQNPKEQFESFNNGDVINTAIEIAGSQAELARQLETAAGVRCYPQKVNEWRVRGVIPPYWVKYVADAAGVDKKKVDPNLYG
jgi:hypothetical protein